jgi:GxxExxY protein
MDMGTGEAGDDPLTRRIIGAAIEVHRALGPGLLESVYETCLAYELRDRGMQVEEQKPLPVVYRDIRLECAHRLDLVIENEVIIELKAVEQLHALHEAQLLSCLTLSQCRAGLLINFNVRYLRQGIRRFVR